MTQGCARQVLLVVDSLDAGGAERHVVELARSLAARGVGVTVACSVSGVMATALVDAGVPVRPIAGRLVKRRASLRYARALRDLIDENRFDLVHAHVHASEVAAAAATAGRSTPLVLTEHTEAPWRRRADRGAAAWAFRCAARVVAVSRPVQRMLVHDYGVPPARTALVRPGVTPPPTDADAAASLAEPPGRGPLVGFAGRLVPSKGVDVLLRAAALLPTPPRLLVVGDGPERAALERLAQRLGFRRYVSFAGFRSDARRLLGRLDLLVAPSRSDGTPLTVVEAMVAGVPVLASAVGGIPEQVTHGVQGLLVPPDDPAALAAGAGRLLRDPPLRRRMGIAARDVGERFSHASMVDALQGLYREVLCESAPAPMSRVLASPPRLPSAP